jgi:molecular chaperone DnaK
VQSDINPAVGIDLGTTNTVVATQTDSMGPMILEIPQPKDERKYLVGLPQIKSAVYFESKNIATVGAFAANRLESFRSIKSHMGTRWKGKHPVTGELLKPSYISAHILKLGFQTLLAQFPNWDKTALITVPASFNTDQRNDTISAARMSGFQDIRLLDEPTAAFYYFLNQHGESGEFKEIRNILIFDFGGGTLDVSIINVAEKENVMLLDAFGRSRYNNLGGDDIDLELATFMIGCWEFESEIQVTELPRTLRSNVYKLFIEKSRLFKEEVEDHLRNKEEMPEFVINEDVYTKEERIFVKFRRILKRSQYEDITGKYFQSKSDLNIYRPIEEAILIAKNIKPDFSKEKLDLILYTGGASNMASVQAALRSYFAPIQCFSISEEDACNTVALGAACYRYEDLYRRRNMVMRNRLLESVFTRRPGETNYSIIVPLTAEPSKEFEKVKQNFKLERPTIRLRLPLFRGTSSHDHQISPIRDLEISLDQVLEKDTMFQVDYRLTENKTIELKVIFDIPNRPVEASAKLDLFDEEAIDSTDLLLCEVNAM